ncbi:MAG: hypothetical protein D6E12_17635 [Desulfovibrio sp.]|nr:MAG: hypothetical protein D6E12_17635 [Desulfovibrio sp.]
MLMLVLAGPAAAQELFRYSQNTEIGEHRVHGALQAGQMLTMMGTNGACSAHVIDSYVLEGMQGPVNLSRIELRPECSQAGRLFAASTNINLDYEALPLTPITPDQANPAFLEYAASIIEAYGDEFYGYGFAQSAELLAYTHVNQDGVDLDFVLTQCDDSSGGTRFIDAKVMFVTSEAGSQAFKLGCMDPVYGVFRLNGVLHLATDWNCCACGGDAFQVHQMTMSGFRPVLENYDFDG